MAQANSVVTPHLLTVQQAAAEIAALIHSRPSSPRIDEFEAIIARVASRASPPALSGGHDEAIADDYAAWRKHVTEAEAALGAADKKLGDPRQAELEAISDAASERQEEFEQAIWKRPARGIGDVQFLAELLMYLLCGPAISRKTSATS